MVGGLAVVLLGACGSDSPAGAADGASVVDGGGPDGGNPLDGGGVIDGGSGSDSGTTIIDPRDPLNAIRDSDCDGLSDAEELGTTYAGRRKTDPLNPDTDGDGIPDGVEVGRTSSIDPNCPSFMGDADPATRTDPTHSDTDGDGIPDGIEDANRNGRVDPGETDPRDHDTDRDGVPDGEDACPLVPGPASNHGCPVDGGGGGGADGGGGTLVDTDGDGLTDVDELTLYHTDPNLRDTDGDGLSDGEEVLVHHTNPLRIDTDCDGLTDFEELFPPSGRPATHPLLADTDGDGLPDGLEVGITVNPDPVSCPNVKLDQDPSTTTDPTHPDSDGDGLLDGVEDRNQNGRVDPGETDPKNPGDGQGVVALACRLDQLRPVLFRNEPSFDVQTARVTIFPDAAVRDITVGGTKVGTLYFDATNGVVAFVISKTPAGADAVAEETAGRAHFNSVGTISAPTTQSVTTWDGFGAVMARYRWAASTDLKTKVNAAVRALLGNPAGLDGLFTDTGVAGPHELHVEYVRRSATQALVVGSAAAQAGFDALQEIRLQDVANGSGIARTHDTTSVQCDVFNAGTGAKVDFLWVIDNSGSMGDDQEALSTAAQAMVAQVQNANLDWRMAVTYTDLYVAPSTADGGDNCTGAPGPGRRRLCPFTRDVNVFQNGTPQCAYVRAGTCGNGSERGFVSARLAIQRLRAGTGCEPVPNTECNLRSDAQLVVIFFTDTGEQTVNADVDGGANNTVNAWVQYFRNYDPARDGGGAQVHGILCPLRPAPGADGGPCSDNDVVASRYDRYSEVVRALSGVEGSILASDQPELPNTIRRILDAVIGAVSQYQLTKPPISATLKVVLERPDGGVEVPRDPANGFAYDSAANSITLLGSFLPDSTGRQVAVSYRSWSQGVSPTVPVCPPCAAPFVCNPEIGQCVCPDDCGGVPAPSPRHRCEPTTCTWTCSEFCNGLCPGFRTCDTSACECQCAQSVTCRPGFRFSAQACDCICDVEALGCNPVRFDIDEESCTCACKPQCGGGCSESSPCNFSECRCVPL